MLRFSLSPGSFLQTDDLTGSHHDILVISVVYGIPFVVSQLKYVSLWSIPILKAMIFYLPDIAFATVLLEL